MLAYIVGFFHLDEPRRALPNSKLDAAVMQGCARGTKMERNRSLHVCQHCRTLVYIQHARNAMPPACPQCCHREYERVVSSATGRAPKALGHLLVADAR